jgi:thiol-disulfide isomerase/thioredoxin
VNGPVTLSAHRRFTSVMKHFRWASAPAVALIVLLISTFVLTPLRAAEGDAMLPFDGGTGWLNGPALTPADLHGKVVLVDFWEYTCINCLRTLPYLREWYRRYHDDGFVIVGVHTPEFKFSGDRQNVEAATKRLDVTWPVVLDDNRAIWNRYHNNIWPHELLYDQNGKLVEDAVGEGNYQLTESRIQALLKAANPQLHLPALMALLPQDSYTKPGSVCYPQTAEVETGSAFGTKIADATDLNDPYTDTEYVDPQHGHQDGSIYLSSYWHTTSQAVISGGNDSALTIRYHAIQVVSVIKLESGSATRVDVTQDGKPIAREDAGADIHYDAGGNSYITVDAPRAYDLIMNKHFGQHELRLSPERYGVGIYSFAFESCEVGADK